MRKRIAFIRPKSWPLANVKVEESLRKQFSDCDFDVFDIQAMVLSRPWLLLINLVFVLALYGRELLTGHKKFREAFWRTPRIFLEVKKLLKNRLSGTEYWFTFQMQSLFDCSLEGVPNFVYTDHTHLANKQYLDFDQRKLYSQKWIDLEKQIYQNAALVFVRSSNIRQSVINQYGISGERVICVYAGSNVEVSNMRTAHKSYEQQNILFVGLDWQRKGGPELVEAFKKVLEHYPQSSLTIVGANPTISAPNCHIVGKVSPEELNRYYEAATMFCMPTRKEPFGIVFVEAMQARLPIVATKVGAVPDFVQNGWNGWLVEPGDVQGIANSLMKLLDSSELCRLFGERNFALAQERYSWQGVGDKIHSSIINHSQADN